jgi:dTDP-4-amino-4,6-dideoxygalactose transaminase
VALIGIIPRRCVNLPPGTTGKLVSCLAKGTMEEGPAVDAFHQAFSQWLGVPYAFGAFSGRSSFQLALEALELEKGAEILFPNFTFPVMPAVAKGLGYQPVFCGVDPGTFNAGPEQMEPRLTGKTRAIVATHLFGQPCPIREIVDLARKRQIRVLEDCAHACGVRVDGRQVGTFGDIGIFSFAEGKNMPCFGGGAIATADEAIARRAQAVLSKAPPPAKGEMTQKAFSIAAKWLLTRPFLFGVTAYQALRLKLWLGQPLMDSAVGDELLDGFSGSNPRVVRLANLQASIGLLHLKTIDRFNEGARRNARILTEELNGTKGVKAPHAPKGDHIYVYYPLVVDGGKRDELRRYLLRHGIDSKITDMSECSELRTFARTKSPGDRPRQPMEASILEICVYPVIPEKDIHHLARVIRTWADNEYRS